MKKVAVLIVFLLLVSLLGMVRAESYCWVKSYGGSGDDVILDVKILPDGSIIAVGYTTSTGAGNADILVMKLSPMGEVIWAKTYGGLKRDEAHAVVITPNGEIIVAGKTESFDAYKGDIWILRLDEKGNVKWQKTYWGKSYDWISAIALAPNGDIIVAGSTQSFGTGDYDAWILRLDENGNVKWQKTYGGEKTDIATALVVTPNDDIIISGYTNSFGTGDYDAWILRLDKNGNVKWQKTYGGLKNEYASALTVTSNDDIIVAGCTESFGAGKSDIWILRLDENGNVKWQRTYGGSDSDRASAVIIAENGDILVAGTTYSIGEDNDNSSYNLGYLWVLRLNDQGEVRWEKGYGPFFKGRTKWFLRWSLTLTENGDIIVAGCTESFGAGGWDAWVIRLPSDGNLLKCILCSNLHAQVEDSNAKVKDTNAQIKMSDTIAEASNAQTMDWSPTVETQYGEETKTTITKSPTSEIVATQKQVTSSQQTYVGAEEVSSVPRTTALSSSKTLYILTILVILAIINRIATNAIGKKSRPLPASPDSTKQKMPLSTSPQTTRYKALGTYLSKIKNDVVTLKFEEIEKIIDAKLPESAKKHRAWWGNDRTHSHAVKGWMNAGWRVKRVDLNNQIVEFERIEKTKPVAEEKPEPAPQKSIEVEKPREVEKHTVSVPVPTPVPDFPTALLSRYEPLEFIGEGGFAKVFKAKRKKDGRIVALKIPRIDEKTSKTFIREVSTWLHLNHPNIVKLYDVDILPVPYLEMEYIEGAKVGDKVVRDLDKYPKPVPEETALKLIKGIANSLKYAHSKGIYHRDLKPLNILLKADLTPKITDWGLAKIGTMSLGRSVMGYTPLYASPEHLMPSKYGHTDARTDIWQLGVTFYELLTGKLPFEGYTYEEVFGKIVDENYRFIPPSKIDPALAKYDAIFEKLLAKRKEARYQSVDEFLKDLEKLEKVEKRKTELEKEVEELKKSLAKSMEALKQSKTADEVLKNRRMVVEALGKLALAYAELNKKADLLNTLNDLKFYTVQNFPDLMKAIEIVELIIKENLPVSEEFRERLKVLVHSIRREYDMSEDEKDLFDIQDKSISSTKEECHNHPYGTIPVEKARHQPGSKIRAIHVCLDGEWHRIEIPSGHWSQTLRTLAEFLIGKGIQNIQVDGFIERSPEKLVRDQNGDWVKGWYVYPPYPHEAINKLRELQIKLRQRYPNRKIRFALEIFQPKSYKGSNLSNTTNDYGFDSQY